MFSQLVLISILFLLLSKRTLSTCKYPHNSYASGLLKVTHTFIFCAIPLALTFHGPKGLPAVARMALLDLVFEYQHACIGTVETTLNAAIAASRLYSGD